MATVIFWVAAAIAVIATGMVITRLNAMHALLYLIVSLLAIAVDFYVLGAPFAAALEVIIYAGAIMVLFVFVIMMLNQGPQSAAQEALWLNPRMWRLPAFLVALLLIMLVIALTSFGSLESPAPPTTVTPQEVGIALFGPYLLGVELASFLLLAGLIGAFHLGRRSDDAIQTHVPEKGEDRSG